MVVRVAARAPMISVGVMLEQNRFPVQSLSHSNDAEEALEP
jgi:hypothetical protein